jgi:hypothetical protein
LNPTRKDKELLAVSVIETKIHMLESVAPDLNLVSKTLDKLIATIADD